MTRVRTIVSRWLARVSSGVITVGAFHAVTKHNVIPDDAPLQLTVRSYTDDVRDRASVPSRRCPRRHVRRGRPPHRALAEPPFPTVRTRCRSYRAGHQKPMVIPSTLLEQAEDFPLQSPPRTAVSDPWVTTTVPSGNDGIRQTAVTATQSSSAEPVGTR